MKNLTTSFSKLDGLYKGGIIFLALFITPVLITLVVDVIRNGAKMI